MSDKACSKCGGAGEVLSRRDDEGEPCLPWETCDHCMGTGKEPQPIEVCSRCGGKRPYPGRFVICDHCNGTSKEPGGSGTAPSPTTAPASDDAKTLWLLEWSTDWKEEAVKANAALAAVIRERDAARKLAVVLAKTMIMHDGMLPSRQKALNAILAEPWAKDIKE